MSVQHSSVRFRGAAIVTVVTLVFLLAPLVSVVVFSFNRTSSLTPPFEGFALRWYREVLSDGAFISAIRASLEVALVVTAVTNCSTGHCRCLRGRQKLRQDSFSTERSVLASRFALPGLFIGISLLVLFERIHAHLSLWTVAAGQTVFVLPFFIMIVTASLSRTDRNLEDAAADLGAGRWRTFFKVTLPLIWPVIAGAACLSFSLAFDELPGISFFLVGEQSTLPLYIWSRLQLTVDPSIMRSQHYCWALPRCCSL